MVDVVLIACALLHLVSSVRDGMGLARSVEPLILDNKWCSRPQTSVLLSSTSDHLSDGVKGILDISLIIAVMGEA